jgi:hypothetical protein
MKPDFDTNLELKEKKYCTGCGQPLNGEALYCSGCGDSLTEIVSVAMGSQDKASQKQEGSNESLINGAKTKLAWRDFLDAALLLRSFVGAAGAIIMGLAMAWLAGIILNKVIASYLPRELFFLENVFRINPLTLLIQAHGMPLFISSGISILGHTITATLSMRFGLLMLLFIPFVANFVSAKLNTLHISPDDLKPRLQLGLTQGVVYGLILTILAKILQSYIEMPLDSIARAIGLEDFVGPLQASALASSGVVFFKALFFAVFWGCLFSLAGAFYASVKFHYSRVIGCLYPTLAGSVNSAFNIFKYHFFISIAVIAVFFAIRHDHWNNLGPVMFFLFFINIIPFAMLVLQGAPFQLGILMKDAQELYSFSLITGFTEGNQSEWLWYLSLILVIPVILGFIGGSWVQKTNYQSKPWKNALGFSLCYTALLFAVILVAQITGNVDAGSLTALHDEIPAKIGIIMGCPTFMSLISIFAINSVSALAGAYFTHSRNKDKQHASEGSAMLHNY